MKGKSNYMVVHDGKQFWGNYDVLRITAIVFVLTQHFYVECVRVNLPPPLFINEIISSSLNFGTVGVGLFFLLSGSLLYQHHNSDNIKDFYSKQWLKLYLPIWISYAVFSIIYYAQNGYLYKTSILQIFFPLCGGNFFAPSIYHIFSFIPLNLVGEWFTTSIIILYIFFPLLCKMFVSKYRLVFTVIIFSIFFLNFKFPILIYQDGHISITIGFFWFWIGMYCELYKRLITNEIIAAIAIVSAFILWFINPSQIFGLKYAPNIPVIFLIYISSFSININFGILRKLSQYTYFIYLTHHTLFIWLISFIGYGMTGWEVQALMFMSVAIVLSISIIEYRAYNFIKSKLYTLRRIKFYTI